MNDWLSTLRARLNHQHALVRVVVVATRGSVPRDVGTCMLVGSGETHGTIGGGHLEYTAIDIARGMLVDGAPTTPGRLDRFTLGATLGQCCGGVVELWFERYGPDQHEFLDRALQARQQGPTLMTIRLDDKEAITRDIEPCAPAAGVGKAAGRFSERLDQIRPALILFGAGHVAQALVRVIADLPLDITWIDNRAAMFPDHLPAHINTVHADYPADEVRDAPADAHFLIMTHDHDLDYELCRVILRRGARGLVGLIGSATKAARFRHRLAAEQLPVERLVCPIGVPGINTKVPAAIAIAAAAQLLQAIEAAAGSSSELRRMNHGA